MSTNSTSSVPGCTVHVNSFYELEMRSDVFSILLEQERGRGQLSLLTMSLNCLCDALNITSFHILIVFHCILMYDDNRYIIIILYNCTFTFTYIQHNMSLRFNGNDAVVIYLKSKWIEINLLCDVTLLTADFP